MMFIISYSFSFELHLPMPPDIAAMLSYLEFPWTSSTLSYVAAFAYAISLPRMTFLPSCYVSLHVPSHVTYL